MFGFMSEVECTKDNGKIMTDRSNCVRCFLLAEANKTKTKPANQPATSRFTFLANPFRRDLKGMRLFLLTEASERGGSSVTKETGKQKNESGTPKRCLGTQ